MSNDGNAPEQIPPSFGEGKPWFLRDVSWIERSPDSTKPRCYNAMICGGTKVSEQLHAAYWDARVQSVNAIAACRAAGVTGPAQYALLDRHNRIMGWGFFDPSDGPDEMAWLTCLFLEMRRWKSALVIPKGVPTPEECEVHVADCDTHSAQRRGSDA
jgi:hypothetical protein